MQGVKAIEAIAKAITQVVVEESTTAATRTAENPFRIGWSLPEVQHEPAQSGTQDDRVVMQLVYEFFASDEEDPGEVSAILSWLCGEFERQLRADSNIDRLNELAVHSVRVLGYSIPEDTISDGQHFANQAVEFKARRMANDPFTPGVRRGT